MTAEDEIEAPAGEPRRSRGDLGTSRRWPRPKTEPKGGWPRRRPSDDSSSSGPQRSSSLPRPPLGGRFGLPERPPVVRAALEALGHQLKAVPSPQRAREGGTRSRCPSSARVARLAKGSAIERISPAALETCDRRLPPAGHQGGDRGHPRRAGRAYPAVTRGPRTGQGDGTGGRPWPPAPVRDDEGVPGSLRAHGARGPAQGRRAGQGLSRRGRDRGPPGHPGGGSASPRPPDG